MSTREIQDVKKLVTGMNTDSSPINQPEGSYRYALNMQSESREGNLSSKLNEEGNLPCGELTSGYKLIGTILINNNNTVLFSTNGTKSEIGILSESCTYTPVIESTCLSFSIDNPITGIYKIHNGCDRIIYFTDNSNPIRSINLDNLIQYTNIVGTAHITPAVANSTDGWDCTMFAMDPEFSVPQVDLEDVIDGGGNLERGTYTFTIRYLDADFNPTNWTDFTQIVPVLGGNSSNYTSLDGGNFDLTGNDLFVEGKAISLSISNLDGSFPYYQLGVIENSTGFLDEGAAYTLTEESFTGNAATYVFTGSSQQRTAVPLTDLTVDSITFNKVKTIEQVNNRMILGNTNDRAIEWAKFQQEASKIVLNYDTVTKSKADYPKNPSYTFDFKSYMRDEIYAFGIVYVFNDGTTSPVFHIPGRPQNAGYDSGGVITNANMVIAGNAQTSSRNTVPGATDWDTQLLDVVTNVTALSNTNVREDNVKHIPLSEFTGSPRVGNQIERWKVYNTATDTQMAYTECDSTYPAIDDCNGDSVWGLDAWGNALEGQPIRHHKFPDATLVPHHDGNGTTSTNLDLAPNALAGNIYPIQVNMFNVTLPTDYSSEIQGFYLVRSVRDQENTTVLDKGYLATAYDDTINIYGAPITKTWVQLFFDISTTADQDDSPFIFSSPKTQFGKEIKDVGYFKVELGYEDVTNTDVNNSFKESLGTSIIASRGEIYNRSTLGYLYMDADSRQEISSPFTLPIENRLVGTSKYYTQWDAVANNNLVSNGADQMYAAAKKWLKPYSNLFNLEYIPTGPMYASGGGAGTVYAAHGGDTFITELTWSDIYRVSGSNYLNMTRDTYGNFFLESTIFSEVRGHGSLFYETHFRRDNQTINDFLDIDQWPDDTDKDFALNYFNYNKMYSQEPTFKKYNPLPITWDYCTQCPNSFPYRLWYSNQSYQESRNDNYRSFLANNYQDLIGSSGELNNLFIFKDQLYAQSDYASWFIPTRPQEIQSNEGVLSVGTGGIFSVPPKRLETADRGYGGCQHRHATVTSEFGTFWPDAEAGKIFLMQGKGLKDITLKGLRNWFAENLPFSIKDQLPNFNLDSHTSKNGVGLQTILDPRHNRIILHKRDYTLIGDAADCVETTDYSDPTPATYGYNLTTREYFTHDGVSETVVDIINDDTLVEEKSWTVSFSMMGEYWDSFLSYTPEWMWTDRYNFFTHLHSGERLFKHGSRNYCVFYEQSPKPSVIDFIFNKNPYTSKVYNSLQYISKAEEYKSGKFVEIPWETWDQGMMYNTSQSSGLFNISSKQDFNLTNPFIEVVTSAHSPIYSRDNEGTFSISEFYDMTINKTETLFTDSWSDSQYKSARQSYGILDYPNSSATSLTKDPFEIEPMRDKWLGARLWYNNASSYKFTTEFVSNRNNISFK